MNLRINFRKNIKKFRQLPSFILFNYIIKINIDKLVFFSRISESNMWALSHWFNIIFFIIFWTAMGFRMSYWRATFTTMACFLWFSATFSISHLFRLGQSFTATRLHFVSVRYNLFSTTRNADYSLCMLGTEWQIVVTIVCLSWRFMRDKSFIIIKSKRTKKMKIYKIIKSYIGERILGETLRPRGVWEIEGEVGIRNGEVDRLRLTFDFLRNARARERRGLPKGRCLYFLSIRRIWAIRSRAKIAAWRIGGRSNRIFERENQENDRQLSVRK